MVQTTWMGGRVGTVRTCPVRHGANMVTCWEPRASFRVQRALQAILVMKWNIPGTDVTQLLTVWTDQVKDYGQQNSNKTFGGFRSSWNPRTHDEQQLSAARKDSPRKTIGIKPTRGVREVRRTRKTRNDSVGE